MELRLKSPSFGCGREGCFAKKAVEKKPVVQASSFLWITTPLGATFILVAGIVLVIVLVAAFRCVRSVWHPRNDSTSDIPDHLRCRFPHSWPSHGSHYSLRSGSESNSPEQGSIISTPSRPIFRIGADSPTSLHPYSNPHRNFHDIQFDRKLLDIQETIGVGEYGQVVRALAFNIDGRYGWTDVAVKNVKADADKHGKEALLAEMSIMRLVEPHNNVVRLLGCCIDADPYFMILEYLPGGNLQDFLRKMGAPSLNPIPMSSQELVAFGYQVALGMNHLACSNVVHRDLAARNILLAADARSVKIADFGLARDVLGFGIYEQKSEVRLPIRWMAPEFLFKGKSSTASDVWSFGVLLWEIGTLGATPYGQSPSEAVMRSVRVGERLQRPSHCSTEFFKVVEECWAEQPELRPSFASIVGKLHSHLALADSIDVMNFHEGLYQKLPSDVPDEKC